MAEIITVVEFKEFLEATVIECFGSMEEFGRAYNALLEVNNVESI